jgi:Ca2+ transporting ATPase
LDYQILNPFKNLFNNWLFWFIQVLTVIVQYTLLLFGGVYVQVVPLNLEQHLVCVAFGSLTIVIGVLIKLIPNFICQKIKLFREIEINTEKMDDTLTSKLRKRSTVRLHTSKGNKDIAIQELKNSQSSSKKLKSSKHA